MRKNEWGTLGHPIKIATNRYRASQSKSRFTKYLSEKQKFKKKLSLMFKTEFNQSR